MAEFFNEYGALLWEGTLETLYMTLFATLFAYVLGLPMGVLLTVTKAGGVAPAPRFNAVFGWLVNLLRSLPFIILMFFIIPFTRLLVGTSIGATAALVPLTLSAAPFIARMVEQSLEEIDTGVIEAAQCMGATRWQIVTRVLLVESVPSLLRGLSISLITILGYTAITGSVGAGGLGNLAFRFGYQRYQKPVMYATVLLLILLFLMLGVLLYTFTERNGLQVPQKSDELFPMIATQGYFPVIVGILFVLGLISAAYSAAGSALTSLTTSFTVDILGSTKKHDETRTARIRKRVHVGMAVTMGVVILIFNVLNNTSVIDAVYVLASYTYGPILGMFAFGIFTKRPVRDRWVPLVALLSPVLCFVLDSHSETWFNGYSFSYELLIFNALFTFAGLCLLIRKK